MTMTTDKIGIACCGNCGSHVEVVCSGGCAEPDVIPRENYIAALPKPRGEEPSQEWKDDTPKPAKAAKYPVPTECRIPGCGAPVAKREKFGVGRPPTKCEKHVVRKKVSA